MDNETQTLVKASMRLYRAEFAYYNEGQTRANWDELVRAQSEFKWAASQYDVAQINAEMALEDLKVGDRVDLQVGCENLHVTWGGLLNEDTVLAEVMEEMEAGNE